MSRRGRSAHRLRCAAVVALALMLPALGACRKQTKVDIGASNGGNTGSTLPECTAGAAPGLRGPAMNHVGRLDGSCFWIDHTEVTRADYDEFLAAAPTNIALCDGENTSFEPASPAVLADPDEPVAGVDWCDAAAFCAYAGKRLCGQYEATGASRSEMETVCTDGDHDGFAYGKTFAIESGHCQGRDTAPAPAQAQTECVTPTGVFDLVGNVREWTAECDGSAFTSPCAARGGSYSSVTADDWGCKQRIAYPRQRTAADLGFRCCADDAD